MQIEIEMQQTPQQRQQPYPPPPHIPLLLSVCVCETMWGASTWLSSAQLNLLNILKNLSRHKSAPGHVNPIFIFTFVRIQTMFRVWCFSPYLPTAPLFERIALSCLQRFQSFFFCFSVFFFFSASFFSNAKLFLNEVRHHLHFAWVIFFSSLAATFLTFFSRSAISDQITLQTTCAQINFVYFLWQFFFVIIFCSNWWD